MSHGNPRHKKRHREKRSHVARPQLVAQPPVHGVEILRRFDTSTFKLMANIECSRALQRLALQEAIDEAS